jgi:hypothetical protein
VEPSRPFEDLAAGEASDPHLWPSLPSLPSFSSDHHVIVLPL